MVQRADFVHTIMKHHCKVDITKFSSVDHKKIQHFLIIHFMLKLRTTKKSQRKCIFLNCILRIVYEIDHEKLNPLHSDFNQYMARFKKRSVVCLQTFNQWRVSLKSLPSFIFFIILYYKQHY